MRLRHFADDTQPSYCHYTPEDSPDFKSPSEVVPIQVTIQKTSTIQRKYDYTRRHRAPEQFTENLMKFTAYREGSTLFSMEDGKLVQMYLPRGTEVMVVSLEKPRYPSQRPHTAEYFTIGTSGTLEDDRTAYFGHEEDWGDFD